MLAFKMEKKIKKESQKTYFCLASASQTIWSE